MDKELFIKTKGFNPKKEFNKKWIEDSIDSEAIEYTKKMGFYLCNYYEDKGNLKIGKGALSNSQIRNIFGEVKRIQMKFKGDKNTESVWVENKSSFLLLLPKLAYASGRAKQKNKKSVLPVLADILADAIIAVKADEEKAFYRFENFVDFLESILAFHKAFGGKEN